MRDRKGERSGLSLHSCVQALLECGIRINKQFPHRRKLLEDVNIDARDHIQLTK